MLSSPAAPAAPEDSDVLAADVCASDIDAVVDWIDRMTAARDLTLARPNAPYVQDIDILIGVLSSDVDDLHQLIAGARDEVRAHGAFASNLMRLAQGVGPQFDVSAEVRALTGDHAELLVVGCEDLRRFSEEAAESINDAASNLEFIDGALSELTLRLSQGTVALVAVVKATRGIAGFVDTLGRLSRQAQMLGINSLIEAAHLADAGTRFAIVAKEVRKLSTSTKDSRTGVAKIAAELIDSTSVIGAAARACGAATSSAEKHIIQSGEALEATVSGIEELGELLTRLGAAVDGQTALAQSLAATSEVATVHLRRVEDATVACDFAGIAAQLDVADQRAQQWQLSSEERADALSETEFGRWIGALAVGGTLDEADDDTVLERRPLVAALRSFLAAVATHRHALLADVLCVASVLAHEAESLQTLGDATTHLNEHLRLLEANVVQLTHETSSTVKLAKHCRTLIAGAMQAKSTAFVKLIDQAITEITNTKNSVQLIEESTGKMTDAAQRVDGIMELLDTISSETNMLSINAAIESSHAGELGLGFGTIADAIGRLSRSTNEATTTVCGYVDTVGGKSADLQKSISAAGKSMKNVLNFSASGRRAITAFRDSFAATIALVDRCTTIAVRQCALAEDIGLRHTRWKSALAHDESGAVGDGRSLLADLEPRAQAFAVRRPFGGPPERIRRFCEQLALQIEAEIQRASEAPNSPCDVFDFTYRTDSGAIAVDADADHVSTDWASIIAEPVGAIIAAAWEAAVAAGLAPCALVVSDLNGRVFAGRSSAADNGCDAVMHFAESDDARRLSRCGLGPCGSEIGPRASYAAFCEAGAELTQTATRPWASGVSAPESHRLVAAFALGLFVDGRRHSTLCLYYDVSLT